MSKFFLIVLILTPYTFLAKLPLELILHIHDYVPAEHCSKKLFLLFLAAKSNCLPSSISQSIALNLFSLKKYKKETLKRVQNLFSQQLKKITVIMNNMLMNMQPKNDETLVKEYIKKIKKSYLEHESKLKLYLILNKIQNINVITKKATYNPRIKNRLLIRRLNELNVNQEINSLPIFSYYQKEQNNLINTKNIHDQLTGESKEIIADLYLELKNKQRINI